jgi:hypothetical protein
MGKKSRLKKQQNPDKLTKHQQRRAETKQRLKENRIEVAVKKVTTTPAKGRTERKEATLKQFGFSEEVAKKYRGVSAQKLETILRTGELPAEPKKRGRKSNEEKGITKPKKIDGVYVESLHSWLIRHAFPDYVRVALPAMTNAEYVAYPKGHDTLVQFVTGIQVMQKAFGKQKRQKRVKTFGLYTKQYENQEEANGDESRMSLFERTVPLLTDLLHNWDIPKTYTYLEQRFHEKAFARGRRTYTPHRFIGYENE